MPDVSLRLRRLRDDARLPAYQSDLAAGLDLHACPVDGQPISVPPGEIALVPCGFAMALPAGYEGQVRPRSGLATRHGVTLANAPGTIDADYRGEVQVPLANHGRETFVVEPGMRIAQLVVAPIVRAEIVEVDELDDTRRGTRGFGSTGSG